MDKISVLEERVKASVRLIQQLKEKNIRLMNEEKRLSQERELLSAENQQVHKLMNELDELKQERKLIRQKCEKLLTRFEKMNI